MGRKEYEKKLKKVREDVDTFTAYLFDKKHGPNVGGSEEELFGNLKTNLEDYLADAERDKKAFNPNINASLATVAARVREYYDKRRKGRDYALSAKLLIRQSYDLVELLVRGKKKARQQASTDPFGLWLVNRMSIHRPLQVMITTENMEYFIRGENLHLMMRPLLYTEPARYTRDIADAAHDMHERFRGMGAATRGYADVLTEKDVVLANRIAERVRDRVGKMNPTDYKALHGCATRLRETLVVLLANTFYAYTWEGGEPFQMIVPPDELRHHIGDDLDCLRKLFLKSDRQQFGTRILQTDAPAVQQEDFSANDWLELKQAIRRRRRRPTKPATTTTTPNAQTKKPSRQSKQEQQEQREQQEEQESKQEWKKQQKPRVERRQAWPLLRPGVRPNPKSAALLARKQQNIQLLQDEIPVLARDLMEKACAKRAGSILLVDARNLGAKRHPRQDFQGRFRKLVDQASTLVLQQARPEDAGQATRPFFVFVDQGDLADGTLRVEDIGDNAVRVRVACSKQQQGGRRVDCHAKTTTTTTISTDDDRKNPMDDYVLLSLYSILTRYYQDAVRRAGGVAQGQLNEVREFLLRNPGAARYSPDVVRQHRLRLRQIREYNKKVKVPITFILSGDLFRDWQFAKA